MNWERATLWTALVLSPVMFLARDAVPRGAPQAIVQTLLLVGMVGIIAHGANWLVDAACRIASVLGVSHLVIGLTVVAVGTSAPEIAASLLAGFDGHGDIAIANVVGSNVFNICFILGGIAVLSKQGLATERDLLRRDGPLLLLGTVLVFVFVGSLPGGGDATVTGAGFWPVPFNRRLERLEGLLLIVMLLSYLLRLYLTRDRSGAFESQFGEYRPTDLPLLLVGLVAVVGGCRVLVGEADVIDGSLQGYGALWFAKLWGVPEHVVGITLIAAGTSAPELVVSLVAAMRGAIGLSAGNLVGSDIFNFYGVVGLSGLLLQPPAADPVSVSAPLVVGIAAPILVVAITLFFMWTGRSISRLEGGLLLLMGAARWVIDFALGT